MKKYNILLILSIVILSFTSCFEVADSPEADELTNFNKYIEANYPELEPSNKGLYFIPQKTGYGDKPVLGDTLTINYIGYLLNGTEFDNTYTDEKAFIYILGGEISVISGFNEGIMRMRQGQTAKFIMPSSLAYGDKQNGLIPPFSSLIFDVELSVINQEY